MSTPPEGPIPEAGERRPIRYFFIRRPVLAGVISIVITLLGLLSIRILPISRYPQITPPAIGVTALYPGAAAEDVAQAVAAPIEEQLSGLQGMLYYSSANSSDGSMQLQVYFDVKRNQDLAAVDVQNAVQVAEPELPDAVRQNGISVVKANTDILGVVALSSNDPRYDAAFLTNYMKLYIEDELKSVPGIGKAQTFGGLQFSMLIQLDPDRMAARDVTVGDVAAAVREQNATNPAGRIGRAPAPPETQLTIPVTAEGRLQTPEEFDAIIIRARPDESIIRISDVGHSVLGAQNYEQQGRLDGRPTALALLFLRPDANALSARDAVVQRIGELSSKLPPGVTASLPFDTTPFVKASIREVLITLLEALLLVGFVVFVFLQSWRATLVPMIAIPVSLVGTFFGLEALGMSINVLTLFALVLAIGIVVDDAIVVIENVERIMSVEGVTARVAADRGIRQVAPALIAIVLSLVAVFVPMSFTGGVTGGLYRQFGITIAIAIVLSGVVALTLTPVLCGWLLKKPAEAHNKGPFGWFNRVFDGGRRRYLGTVEWLLHHAGGGLAGFVVVCALAAFLWYRVPSSFIPTEDKGYFAVAIQLPDAASLQRTEAVVEQVEGFLRQEPAVKGFVTLAGLNILSQAAQTNSATIFVSLEPWSQRGANQSVEAVTGQLSGRMYGLTDAIAYAFNLPEIPGLGTTAGVDANLQDRSGRPVSEFAGAVRQFLQEAGGLPSVTGLQTQFSANVPQLHVGVDKAAAKARGVEMSELYGTLQALLSTLYINDFNLYGRTYRVQAEAAAPFRQTPADIGRFYVRGAEGAMIPVSSLVQTEYRSGPTLLNRFDGFTSAMLNGSPASGWSSGQMMHQLDSLVQAQFASQGIQLAYSGQSYQERHSSGSLGIVLGLGLVFVFLVLAAQYDSWSLPLAVLLGVPFGILGVFVGIFLRGIPADIFVHVGLITVVGLSAKNAILIVEFANRLHHEGVPVMEATLQAAHDRLRPILMTSFAFIFGVAPLMIEGGAGAASRHSIGTTVFSGMLVATAIAILFIPLFFRVIRGIAESRRGQTGEEAPA